MVVTHQGSSPQRKGRERSREWIDWKREKRWTKR